MREFFQCWRRNIGCLILLLACLLSSAWIRSLKTCDEAGTWIGSYQHRILLLNGRVKYKAYKLTQRIGWTTRHANPVSSKHAELAEIAFEQTKPNSIQLELPYWAIVLPVTALAGYLLLWKPRKLT